MSYMDMKIEYDKPVPPAARRGRPSKYNWGAMKPGGSVAFSVKDEKAKTARASAHQYSRRHGWKMSSRKLGEFVRIWRVS